jgi:hypothetical protein
MLETIRKYWIGFLVLALVFLHASIVGIIRHQASLAKQDVSCEVPLGEFIAYRTKDDAPVEMTLHAMVPLKQRMKSRQLIELNATQVRQALEERLRQFDARHLADPYMTDLRAQLLEVLTQLLGASSVEDLLITRIRPIGGHQNGMEFVSNAPRPEPRRLVATLRGDQEQEESESADQTHGQTHGQSHGSESSTDEHGSSSKRDSHASHGAKH